MDGEQSTPRYTRLMELVPDVIYTMSGDGTITSLSKSFEKVTGWKRSEWLGKHFSPLIHPQDLKKAQLIFGQVLSGKILSSYELKILSKPGNFLTMEFNSVPDMVDGKIIGKIGIARNITKHKRSLNAEAYLAKATKILTSSLNYNETLKKLAKLLVPTLADWCSIHVVDEQGKIVQLTVAHEDPKKVEWALALQKKFYQKRNRNDPNNSVYRILRSGKSELYPKIDDTLLKKSVSRKSELDLIKKLNMQSVLLVPLMSGKKTFGVITLVSTDADELFDEEDLKFTEELGRRAGQAIENARAYKDAETEIAERKKIQAELSASREQLKVILENVADGITVYDEKGKVVFVNKAVAIASGYKSAQEMLDKPVAWADEIDAYNEKGELIPANKVPGKKSALGKKNIEETIRSVNRKTGEEKWAQVKARPIFDSFGKVKGSVSITSDITEAKELERKKDDFISVASHELKTPITSIKGYIHLLKSMHEAQDLHYLYLEKVEKQLGKLSELVEDLLEMSRIRSGKLNYKKEKFVFSKLVQEVVSDMQEIDETHKIVLKNGIRKSVFADRERISQVLINLITNAVKYSPNSKKVIVKMDKVKDNVQVGVQDFGIGISMRESSKIFDRFYRVEDMAHKTFPGLGIGLFLSKEIVERHNGKIWFKSKKGKGSTFYFQIPSYHE